MATTKTRIGNLFFNYQGDYSSTKAYIKDDVVLHNNSDYICVKNSSTTGVAPDTGTEAQQKRYARVTIATSASTGGNAYKWDGESTWPQTEVQYKIGDTLVLYQDGNDFDDNKIAFSNSATSKETNLFHTDVTYMLDGKSVGGGTASGNYFNSGTFNNATKREIRIEITAETPKEIYIFNFDNPSATWGPKMVVAENQVWKEIRQSFKWRGDHSEASIVYNPNDLVHINVPVDNDFSTNNQYSGDQIQNIRATYVCLREHTSGVAGTLPWDQDTDTDANKYWERIQKNINLMTKQLQIVVLLQQ